MDNDFKYCSRNLDEWRRYEVTFRPVKLSGIPLQARKKGWNKQITVESNTLKLSCIQMFLTAFLKVKIKFSKTGDAYEVLFPADVHIITLKSLAKCKFSFNFRFALVTSSANHVWCFCQWKYAHTVFKNRSWVNSYFSSVSIWQ